MTRRWQGSLADEMAVAAWRAAPADGARAAPWPPPLPAAVGATPTTAAPRDEAAPTGRWLECIFLLGLAGVFLANAAVAWLDPDGFTALVEASRVGRWLGLGGAGWLVPVICFNDLVVGVTVFAAIWWRRAPRQLVLAWAGLWLLAVTVLKLTALNVFGSL